MLYGPAVTGPTIPSGQGGILPQESGVGSDIIALVQGIGVILSNIVCSLYHLYFITLKKTFILKNLCTTSLSDNVNELIFF